MPADKYYLCNNIRGKGKVVLKACIEIRGSLDLPKSVSMKLNVLSVIRLLLPYYYNRLNNLIQ